MTGWLMVMFACDQITYNDIDFFWQDYWLIFYLLWQDYWLIFDFFWQDYVNFREDMTSEQTEYSHACKVHMWRNFISCMQMIIFQEE